MYNQQNINLFVLAHTCLKGIKGHIELKEASTRNNGDHKLTNS